MSINEIKAIYESLLDSGDLFTLFSNMKGEWELDKSRFKKLYDQNQKFIDEDFIDLDDSFDLYEEY
jgi:hypothetical protein